jgi:hypothetical protein
MSKANEETNPVQRIVINRVWAMPNKNTFSIKPIGKLIQRYLTGKSIDPFANSNKLASITNDLNTEFDTDYHLDALEFLKNFDDESIDLVLFDPPYSPRQVSECYKSLDMTVNMQTTQSSFWSNMKKEIARIVKPRGKVITCGWNSGGVGKTYGFKQLEILLVPHGGWHNDTIVTVEQKGL